MLIRRLKIENLRSFEKVDLELTRPDGSLAGFTVLAGRNGSGKSTLLKAIVLVTAGRELSQALEPGLMMWIRQGTSKNRARLELETDGLPLPSLLIRVEDQRLQLGHDLTGDFLSHLLKKNNGQPVEVRFGGDSLEFNDLVEAFRNAEENNRKSLVLLAYGPQRRLTGQSSEAQRLQDGAVEIARVANLFRGDTSLVESVTWLREIYLRRLEGSASHKELEGTVVELLNDGLLPDGATVDRVDSDGLWIHQQGVELNLRELSDGYRTVAALVLDIVRHLHGAYGDLRIEKSGKRRKNPVRVLNEAVVLIDEIEMHLHVSWQRRIGFWLKEHFPAIQFIVTTHSPFVCQAADLGGLIRLPAPGESRSVERVSDELYYTVVNGSLDEAVISELFGLETPYSAEAEALRDEVAEIEARLISGKPTARDRKKLVSLRQKLPRSMSSDVELAVRSLEKK